MSLDVKILHPAGQQLFVVVATSSRDTSWSLAKKLAPFSLAAFYESVFWEVCCLLRECDERRHKRLPIKGDFQRFLFTIKYSNESFIFEFCQICARMVFLMLHLCLLPNVRLFHTQQLSLILITCGYFRTLSRLIRKSYVRSVCVQLFQT